MIVVSIPHKYLLNLNQKYFVYDSDDGKVEEIYADEILHAVATTDWILNLQQGHFGGMHSNGKVMPDGIYKVYSEFEEDAYMRIKNGKIVEPKGCEDADFVGTFRGIEYKFVKGKAVRL